LHHTFEQHPQLENNPTQNLLDYSATGTITHQYQWAGMHDPSKAWTMFDEDEDRANLAEGNLDYKCIKPAVAAELINEGYQFVDIEGNPIEVSETPIAFAGPDETPERQGTLIAIKKDNIYYGASIALGETIEYYQKFVSFENQDLFIDKPPVAGNNPVKVKIEDESAIVQSLDGNTIKTYENATQGCSFGSSDSEDEEVVSKVTICNEIPVDDVVPSANYLDQAVLKLNATYSARTSINLAIRPMGKYHHIETTSANEVPMSKSNKEQLDEKLFLLQYHTQYKFFVLFQEVGSQLSRETAAQYARDIIEASSIPESDKENVTLLIVPYNNVLEGLTLSSCGIPGISNPALLSEEDYSKVTSVFDLAIRAFSNFEKPINTCLIVMLSNGNLRRFYQKVETKVSGFSSINQFEIFRSKHDKIIRDFRANSPEYPKDGTNQQKVNYIHEMREFRISLQELILTARSEEALALNGINQEIFEPEPGNVRLRESYMSDETLQDKYALYHVHENDGYISSEILRFLGTYEFDDTEHFHNQITFEPIIYGTIDAFSLILSPVGLDFIPDAIGLVTGSIYSMVYNTDSEAKIVEYAAAFFIPFSLDKAAKVGMKGFRSVRRIENDGTVVYKLLDEGEELRSTDVLIRNIYATKKAKALKVFDKDLLRFKEVVKSFHTETVGKLAAANTNLSPSQLQKMSNDIFTLIPLSQKNPDLITENLAKLIAESSDESLELMFGVNKWTDPTKFSKFEGDLNDLAFFEHIKANVEQIRTWDVVKDLPQGTKLNTTNLERLSRYIDIEGVDIAKLKNSLTNTKDAQKWIDLKLPKSDLDNIYAGFKNDPPFKHTPWTPEHKAQRWKNYEEGCANGQNACLNFESWSNGYDGKIDLVTNANKGVDDYFSSLGWNCPASTCREKTLSTTIDGKTVNRRLDIFDEANRRGKEFKEYSSGKVYRSADIRSEVARDKQLLEELQILEMEWVFKGCEPSGPLRTLLESLPNPITIILIP